MGMTAKSLLADLASRGVSLETDGARIRWRPAFMLTGGSLLESIRQHKAELIALLLAGALNRLERCPACGRPVDARRRCWRCHDRPCERCGRRTGSAFLALCLRCGIAREEE